MGRRGNGDQTMEHPRGSRHHYQHGQHDIDFHYDVVVDAVEDVGSSGIGENVLVAEKMVTGARVQMMRTKTLMKHIAETDCDVECVDRSTIHRYQEPRYFQGADDVPLK